MHALAAAALLSLATAAPPASPPVRVCAASHVIAVDPVELCSRMCRWGLVDLILIYDSLRDEKPIAGRWCDPPPWDGEPKET